MFCQQHFPFWATILHFLLILNHSLAKCKKIILKIKPIAFFLSFHDLDIKVLTFFFFSFYIWYLSTMFITFEINFGNPKEKYMTTCTCHLIIHFKGSVWKVECYKSSWCDRVQINNAMCITYCTYILSVIRLHMTSHTPSHQSNTSTLLGIFMHLYLIFLFFIYNELA